MKMQNGPILYPYSASLGACYEIGGCQHMDSFIGSAYFGYILRQTGWPVVSLQCFHDGHNVQSPKSVGRNQLQYIIPVLFCFF